MASQTTDGRAELGRVLGPGLPALERLDGAECAELAELIEQARVDQRAELDRSLDAVLGRLPRLVRGPARKIMFGGGSRR